MAPEDLHQQLLSAMEEARRSAAPDHVQADLAVALGRFTEASRQGRPPSASAVNAAESALLAWLLFKQLHGTGGSGGSQQGAGGQGQRNQ